MAKEGVMLLMYDLPIIEKEQRREYTKFRKLLKKYSYRQLQESVYVKHLRNISFCDNELKRFKKEAPEIGNIMAFSLTMSQFKSIEVIRGGNILQLDTFNNVMEV